MSRERKEGFMPYEELEFGSVGWKTDSKAELANSQFRADGGHDLEWQCPANSNESQVMGILKNKELKVEVFNFLNYLRGLSCVVRVRKYDCTAEAMIATKHWKYSKDFQYNDSLWMRLCAYTNTEGVNIIAIAYCDK